MAIAQIPMTQVFKRSLIVCFIFSILVACVAREPQVQDLEWMKVLAAGSPETHALVTDWEKLCITKLYQDILLEIEEKIATTNAENGDVILCELVQLGSIGEQHRILLLTDNKSNLVVRGWYPYEHTRGTVVSKQFARKDALAIRRLVSEFRKRAVNNAEFEISPMRPTGLFTGWAFARFLFAGKGGKHQWVVGGNSESIAASNALFLHRLLSRENLRK